MNCILLLIEHQNNRRLLSKWLAGHYQVISPSVEDNFSDRGEQLLSQPFDLCFIDFASVHKLREKILARREAENPVFLPFIFLTPNRDVGISSDHLEDIVDDIIHIPIDKIEFQTFIESLPAIAIGFFRT